METAEEIKARKMRELMEKHGGIKVEKAIEIEANDANFEKEVMERSKSVPVVVDFYADWCMPCKLISPVLEKLAREFDGRFVLAKLNTQFNPVISNAAGITSIPAVAFVKDGKVASGFIGLRPEEQIREWLNTNLGK